MKKLSHIDKDGNMCMVNVSLKPHTARKAIAQTVVELAPDTLRLLLDGNLPKGDALACARVGAILAAKRTSELIPMCHPLPLTYADIKFEICEDPAKIRILAEAQCTGQTGVEMEAIIAAQTAGAIIYDMAKAVQKDIKITDTRLLYKTGGKSGEYRAPGYEATGE